MDYEAEVRDMEREDRELADVVPLHSSRRHRRPKKTPSPINAAAPATIVPPPSQPMAVARDLVKACYVSGNDFTLRCHRGDFYQWTGTHYPEVDHRDMRGAAYGFLEHACYLNPDDGKRTPFAPTRRKIDDVLDALRAIVIVPTAADAPAWTTKTSDVPPNEIISMENGLLHVKTRTLFPHTPTFFSHHALPFPFLADAPQPDRWLRFLRELWTDDESAITALQEVFGYVLSGDTTQQKIFLLCGPKRGGKGTIGRILTGLLGMHHVAGPTLASLSTNFGLQPLVGKPLALVSDARLSSKADSKIVVERLLSISGEDCLTIDRKYRDPWTGRLPTRFVILTNELPRLTDSSGALASRFILFVLTKSFYGSENPTLTNELLAEAPGIFNWAMEGLDRLNARGYFLMPESGRDAVQQLEDLSSPISAFIRERCELGCLMSVEPDTLWAAWKTWCESDNRPPGTKAVFGRDLKAAVPTMKRFRPRREDDADHGRPYAYHGIGLRGNYSAPDLGPLGPEPSNGPCGPSGPSNSPLYRSSEATGGVGHDANLDSF